MLPVGFTLNSYGTVTAPGANVGIAFYNSGQLPAGWYKCIVQAGYGSVAETATLSNWVLSYAGSAFFPGFAFAAQLLAVPNNVVNSLYTFVFDSVYIPGGNTFQVQARAAASAGAIYVANLIMTPLAYNG